MALQWKDAGNIRSKGHTVCDILRIEIEFNNQAGQDAEPSDRFHHMQLGQLPAREGRRPVHSTSIPIGTQSKYKPTLNTNLG
jgi:hypothetical protein